MENLRLLITYTEWKKSKLEENESLNSMSDTMARAIELTFKDNKTNQEEEELKRIISANQKSLNDKKFTELTHEITDMVLNPKDETIDFEEIGKLQCKIERMKYPIVLPENNG